MGGLFGHQNGKIVLGNGRDTKISGKHEINGGLKITSELNKKGGKSKILQLINDCCGDGYLYIIGIFISY